MSTMSMIIDDIEEYGNDRYNEGYDEGYESGYEDGADAVTEDEIRNEEAENRRLGLIKRTHDFNGQIVHLWIKGPDFNEQG